mgnify:CR=1 FL=1
MTLLCAFGDPALPYGRVQRDAAACELGRDRVEFGAEAFGVEHQSLSRLTLADQVTRCPGATSVSRCSSTAATLAARLDGPARMRPDEEIVGIIRELDPMKIHERELQPADRERHFN